MKVYMVWVYDWPQEMIFINENPSIKMEHDRDQLKYGWQSRMDSSTAYIREEKEIKEVVKFFELEPDEMKEVEL